MKTKYTRKNRIISMLLCVTLVLGLVLPSGVRANDASKIYEAAELATGGVPLVPAALLEDLSFMGDYVENGGSMSLNSQFSRYKTENADGAGDTLPNGVIDGHQSKAWYASYRWSATREQRDVINRPDVELSFNGIHTTVDTYTVYVANDAAYKIVTESVTDGQGLTDEENTEYQLDYWSGDRPAENLDNVAVAVRITNERDGSAAMGEGFGLQFLDYTEGNGAFRLYYIGDSRPGEEKPDGTPVKTWDLVNSSDGRQTIVFEPGLCSQSGWYTLWLETEDTYTGKTLGRSWVSSSWMPPCWIWQRTMFRRPIRPAATTRHPGPKPL